MSSSFYICNMISVVFLAGAFFQLCYGLLLNPPKTFVEKLLGSDFDVTCSGSDTDEANWYNQNGDLVDIILGNVFSHKRGKAGEVILTFNNITINNAGNYTCVGKRNGEIVKARFELSVIPRIEFRQQQTIFYAEEGNEVVLPCELLTADKRTEIVWKHNGQIVEGVPYSTVDEHNLVIKNITDIHFGNYICSAFLNTDQLSDSHKLILTLKRAEKPSIVSETDIVYSLLNTTADIECEVVSEPPAEISWYRNNHKVFFYANMEIVRRNNASILKVPVYNSSYFGEYVCSAQNEIGNDTKIFYLHETILPASPKVNIHKIFSDYIQLDISSVQGNLTHVYYKFNYSKDNENDTSSTDRKEWKCVELNIKTPETEPYSINELEPNTRYIFQVGSCIRNVCNYTKTSTFTTQVEHTSKSSIVLVPYISALIIPSLFIAFK